MSRSDDDAACRDVAVRALRALDERDYDTMAASFAADGVWERGGVELVGPAAVREALEKRPARLETRHVATNMTVEAVSDTVATVRYILLAYAQTETQVYHLHAIFDATDRLTRDGDHWRFSRRTVTPSFLPRG